MKRSISGFSKMSKRKKLKWIVENFFKDPDHVMRELKSYWLRNEDQQRILDGFSENTISNYYLPYGVAPNFVVNGKTYCVPMVIEESSVVAAASSAAKFWMDRGGFHAEVLSTQKEGQIHFYWQGDPEKLKAAFPDIKAELLKADDELTANMKKRGGGVTHIALKDWTDADPGYYQIKAGFETCDSMGANFINSILEQYARTFVQFIQNDERFVEEEKEVDIIMAILSNYTPKCMVRTWVECPVELLGDNNGLNPTQFAEKFRKAIRIAHLDPYRATTHNKGIFNGVDAVVLATANDFRAIEACGHTYAARTGQYRSLSHCSIENGIFRFWLDLPLAVGTVGGLTKLHPVAKRSLELLGNPDARELMTIIAATGLAQNFAAVRSLITTGIQKGHMKMHLLNMLNHLEASEKEAAAAVDHFHGKVVSFKAVRDFLDKQRGGKTRPVKSLLENQKKN